MESKGRHCDAAHGSRRVKERDGMIGALGVGKGGSDSR